jgi:hypothetical protein
MYLAAYSLIEFSVGSVFQVCKTFAATMLFQFIGFVQDLLKFEGRTADGRLQVDSSGVTFRVTL